MELFLSSIFSSFSVWTPSSANACLRYNADATSFLTLSLGTGNYEDTAITLGDLNNDKRLDVVVTNHPGKNPRIFLCSRSGDVSYSTAYVGLHIPQSIGYKARVVDFNGDMYADVVVGTQAGLRVFLGNGCEGLESKWWREVLLKDKGSQTMQLSVGDINNDGKVDIASASASGIWALFNSGAALFTARARVGLPERRNLHYCIPCSAAG